MYHFFSLNLSNIEFNGFQKFWTFRVNTAVLIILPIESLALLIVFLITENQVLWFKIWIHLYFAGYSWAPLEPSGNIEYLELEIPVPVHIKEIRIYGTLILQFTKNLIKILLETNWQGTVVKVSSRINSLYDWNVIWQGPTTFE